VPTNQTNNMKNLNEILKTDEEAKSQSELFNLWGKDGRDSSLLLTGTKEECENELKKNYDENHPDYEISVNGVRDQWEDEVSGMGYITFHNDVIISYAL
jgi:hypothetical protein